jgi:hypothetical protein
LPPARKQFSKAWRAAAKAGKSRKENEQQLQISRSQPEHP